MREYLKDKKRIIVKIGSSSLQHVESGGLDLRKIEKMVRILADLKNQGKDVILVSSGAIAVGRKAVGMEERPATTAKKQALAAIGQARLMMVYQKLFAEYGQTAAQVLVTKYTMVDEVSRGNARNTFEELFAIGAIPVVNENDTVATHEIEFGDNDRLSAVVAALIGADLLILLSDIDGMFTDDPNKNPEARLIPVVRELTGGLCSMAKGTSSSVGTGGMSAKLAAARIAAEAGADMVITNGNNVENIHEILEGKEVGTLFIAHKDPAFDLIRYLKEE